MIFATTPAYSLPPYCRSLKFDEFDGLCKRAARTIEADAWTPGDTLLGGLHGEVALEQVGAVPTVELEG